MRGGLQQVIWSGSQTKKEPQIETLFKFLHQHQTKMGHFLIFYFILSG